MSKTGFPPLSLKWKGENCPRVPTSGTPEQDLVTAGLWLQLVCCTQVSSLGVPAFTWSFETYQREVIRMKD